MTLIVQLYNATPEGGLADSDVTGDVRWREAHGARRRTLVTLKPGESITLEPWC